MDSIPEGYCQCGCGEKTPIAARTDVNNGWIKGKPIRFINRHRFKGKNHYNWKGGIKNHSAGYIAIWQPDHNRNSENKVYEHILVAEKALREPLPLGSVVHHVNGIRNDNRSDNLVVCQDGKYHRLLHQRQRAYEACGHADWMKCLFCKEYDDPKNMYVGPNNRYHRKCHAEYNCRAEARKDGR